MSTLVSIDPGIAGCGAARFIAGELVHAALFSVRCDKFDDLERALEAAEAIVYLNEGASTNQLIIERPQVYSAGKGKGDPNLLIPLAAIAGACAMRAPNAVSIRWIKPHDWKGTLPKAKKGEEYIVERRVMERLSESERSTIHRAGALSHNVFDAIGIGLFHLGRFDRKRVIAR